MITVDCPKCRAAYKVDEKRIPPAGGVISCKNCQTKIHVKPPASAPAQEVLEELSEADEVADPPPDMTAEEPTLRAMRKPAFAAPPSPPPAPPPAPSPAQTMRGRADALLSAVAKAAAGKPAKAADPAQARPVAPGASLYECPHCRKPFYLREAKKQSDAGAFLTPAAPEPAPPPDGRKTVLVVDDQEFFRTFARDLLSPRHRVLEAESLTRARALIAEADLLILDLTLGGENGRELLKFKPASCRCLIFSGQDELANDPAAFRELQREGADDLLTKSITAGEELKRKAGALLGEQERQRLTLD